MASPNLTRLKNHVQHYHWGTRSSIAVLLNQADLISEEPVAEYWIGTHPLLPSEISDTGKTLPQFLAEHTPDKKSLPFLVKLLSAESPLSIQVHPNKTQAESGYQRENQAGIAINDPARNYKDNNHKPETLFALSPFDALTGFRTRDDIVRDIIAFDNERLSRKVICLSGKPEAEFLKSLMEWLLSLSEPELKEILDNLISKVNKVHSATLDTVANLFNYYRYDAGVLMGLMLNKISLQPGESLFLNAGMPHAYLQGTGIEIMASSDNVLRAGLTPKHIDKNELMRVVAFKSDHPEIEQCNFNYGTHSIAAPVMDFQAQLIICENTNETIQLSGEAEVFFVVSGSVSCDKEKYSQGESFIATNTHAQLNVSGRGQLFRVFSQLRGQNG